MELLEAGCRSMADALQGFPPGGAIADMEEHLGRRIGTVVEGGDHLEHLAGRLEQPLVPAILRPDLHVAVQ